MRVFSLMNGADTAGIGYRLARAFEQWGGSDWHLDAMVAAQNYIGYPVDVPWDQRTLERLYDEADVVIIHHFVFAHDNYDFGQGKPTIMMHHGLKNGDENTFAAMVKACSEQGITQICSTLDMAIWAYGVQWVPAPYDLDWLRKIRQLYYWPNNGGDRPAAAPIRIVHAPTNREVKGTALLEEAVRQLAKHYPVELLLIEKQNWQTTLRQIASADLAFDQPTLGYGCFAVEAMGMGLPTLAGVTDRQVHEGMLEQWGQLPFRFVEPTVASIREQLEVLLIPEAAKQQAAIGTAHVERYHDARMVVARLKPILEAAGPSVPGGANRRVTAVGGGPRKPVPVVPVRRPIRGRPLRRIRR